MFAAPPIVETRILATLPKDLRTRKDESDFGNYLTKAMGRPFDSIFEGPAFDRAENLYWVDVALSRIFRLDPEGRIEIAFEYDGAPSGLAIHRDGRLFICDKRYGVIAVDPAKPRIERIVEHFDLEPFRGASDLDFSPEGDLYFTDQGMSDVVHPTGRLFRRRANGQVELLIDHLPGPNGVVLDSSGRTVLVALTRENRILRVPLLPDGRVTRVSNFIQMSGGVGPDGIAADDQGGLAVSHPMMGAVWLFDAKGQPILRVNLCQGLACTNVAFGGPDRRRLYITEAETATIQIADSPVRGATLFSHR
jgi:gluconolactonase